MAEANFDEFVAGAYAPRATMSRFLNIAGAISTLALVAGVAVWGYRLAVRDANGVPVIIAMEGPVRVAPDDAGGEIAAHVGLSVNRIAAEGTAGEVPDQIVLAEPPVGLEDDDAPGIGAAAPEQPTEADTLARTLALAEELARQAAAEIAAEDAIAADDSPPLPGNVVQRSPRPMPRPGQVAGIITNAARVSAEVPVATEIDPTSLIAGTRLAQIGAFDDMDSARQEWARVAALHPALFEGKNRIIQPANAAGRQFYRLRVQGFDSEDDSRRFCSAIEAGDLRCNPVTVR